jgi:hypothetical protein
VLQSSARLDLGLHPADHGSRDLVSADGQVIVEVAERLIGVRDLHAKLVQLTLLASPRRAEAVLVLLAPRLSSTRVHDELDALRAVLSPDVGARLAVVRIDGEVVDRFPDSPLTRAVATHFGSCAAPLHEGRADRSGEVLKVLAHRWLIGGGQLTTRHLQDLTGLSYPTVAEDLRELGDAITRSSNRSVSLRTLPQDAWTEMRARRTRHAAWFADASGRLPDLDHLIQRLRRLRPVGVAVAGILSAKRRYADLDLVGLPRLDLSVHAPAGVPDFAFLRRLDPALVRVASPHDAMLAVHVVPRADALFEPDEDGSSWADPVETLLDLQELRLNAQADAFVQHLRSSRTS